MIEVTKGELKTFYPKNNNVLVRPVLNTNIIQTKSGVKLYVDTTYKPENHAAVVCEIAAIPKHLIYTRKKKVPASMEWKTVMDIRIGDLAWCNYLAILMAEKLRTVKCGDEKYYIIPYDKLYLVKRQVSNEEKIRMLNGYVLVELEDVKQDSTLELLKEKSLRFGHVRYLGEPNLEYKHPVYYDDDRMREGDRVMLAFSHNKKLENSLHAIFNDGREYTVTQRSRIVSIFRQ